jgi:hypothetical protein
VNSGLGLASPPFLGILCPCFESVSLRRILTTYTLLFFFGGGALFSFLHEGVTLVQVKADPKRLHYMSYEAFKLVTKDRGKR